MKEFIFTKELFDEMYLPKGYWEKQYEPSRTSSTAVTELALTIAQDVEYVVLDSARTDKEGCSGHECFFRRTGVRCSRCKNKD